VKRVAEPTELMDDSVQALAYASANFSEANNLFIHLLQQLLPHKLNGHALDLGCGPAAIPIALLRQHDELKIDAVDGAAAMLKLAEDEISGKPQLKERLCLINETLPSANLREATYDMVLSNSLLHHLADPLDLWITLQSCARDGASVLIMDLARPPSAPAVDSLVESYAMNEPEVLREDFRNSLFAAYTVDEVQQQLLDSGLTQIEVKMVSDRHWVASGNFKR